MDPNPIARRKDEHLDLALRQGEQARGRSNGFDDVALEHCALPEIAVQEVDLRTTFLGKDLSAPFLISAMTGGPCRGAEINARLAEAAQELGVALAVGSQRVALEGGPTSGLDRSLRDRAPDIPIWANLGAAQLVRGYGLDEARRAIDMLGADALVIHLNPLQEALQPGGDRNWRGVLGAIARLAAELGAPVIVKEVGAGLSAAVVRRLADAGVAAVDVAGLGGTAWSAIETARAETDLQRSIGEAFDGWGVPTPLALLQARAALPNFPLIGSGGVRHGVDAAKAIRLGADLVGQAGAVLPAALTSTEAVVAHVSALIEALRIACFCTGAQDLTALRLVRLTPRALPLHDL